MTAADYDRRNKARYRRNPLRMAAALVSIEAAVFRSRIGLAHRVSELEREVDALHAYLDAVTDDLDAGLTLQQRREQEHAREAAAETYRHSREQDRARKQGRAPE